VALLGEGYAQPQGTCAAASRLAGCPRLRSACFGRGERIESFSGGQKQAPLRFREVALLGEANVKPSPRY
jgi:hypothetical protein